MDASPHTASKSDQLLDELKRRQQARQIVDVEEERVKIVVFSCGDNQYAFYGSEIREILPSCEIFWVPGLPPFLPGLINVRGEIEAVIDIRHFLGEADGKTANALIVLAGRSTFRSGVIIDTIEDVVDIPKNSIQPPLETLQGTTRDLVCGTILFGGKHISLLDLGRLAALVSL